jgi:hypothetical protein
MIREARFARKIDSPRPASRFFSFIRYEVAGLFQQPANVQEGGLPANKTALIRITYTAASVAQQVNASDYQEE